MSFVDRVEVQFQAGRGGDGVVSFHHEKSRPLGGPDGGDGGNGGDITLRASRNQNTLANFRYRKLLKAENGQSGRDSKQHGKSGQALVVELPIGTVVLSNSGELLADLTADGQTITIARGGKGGYGNAHFTSSRRQAPRIAEKGEPGQSFKAILELKMIADVGVIGLPNAGKSTLLSVISNAHPAIANYPFTTLSPNLGVVDVDKQHSLLFADIPGLIAGASRGKGLGDEFLRHVERTSILLHLVDIYNDDLVKAYKTILKELKDYQIDLSRRPQIVVLTKTEGFDKRKLTAAIQKLEKIVPKNTPVLAISSSAQAGLRDLLRTTLKLTREIQAKTDKTKPTEKLPVIGLKADDDWQITPITGGFEITGPKIERFARRTNFGNYHAEQRLRDILHKLGIMTELKKRGASPGDKVAFGQPAIGHISF